jgi:hypothetical protein
MSRPPTADEAVHAGLRHAHVDSGDFACMLCRRVLYILTVQCDDAGFRSSLAITEFGISNTQDERPDGGRKMVGRLLAIRADFALPIYVV